MDEDLSRMTVELSLSLGIPVSALLEFIATGESSAIGSACSSLGLEGWAQLIEHAVNCNESQLANSYCEHAPDPVFKPRVGCESDHHAQLALHAADPPGRNPTNGGAAVVPSPTTPRLHPAQVHANAILGGGRGEVSP